MSGQTAGAILILIGAVAIFAAIVGGGIKIQQIEVGSVQSKWRQWLLAGFGLIIGITGLGLVVNGRGDEASPAETENVPAPDENAAPTEENVATPDENLAEISNEDKNNNELEPAAENAPE